MISFEPLAWTHIREFDRGHDGVWAGISDNRLRFLPMIGYVARDQQGVIKALGGVVWFGPGGARAEGMFSMTEDFRASPHSRWVHRDTLEVLELAHRISPVIYARIDAAIPQAEEWARRLGFVRDREQSGEMWWKREANVVHSSGVDSGGVVHRGERGNDHGDCLAAGRGHVGLRRLSPRPTSAVCG